MRIAIVHDCLIQFGGAEKLLEQVLLLYPHADLFSLFDFFPEEKRSHLLGKRATTTFLQKWPGIRNYYRYTLPLMPLAIEQLDLTSYDLIISVSYAVAKGILVRPGQRHICLCCTPMRYIWDLRHHYFPQKGILSLPLHYIAHRLRIWDVASSLRVSEFIAISDCVKERIATHYQREAKVIYPPVAISRLPFSNKKESFYMTASRLVSYKRIDLIIEAFANMEGRTLIIIGEGPLKKKWQKKKMPHIHFLGHLPEEELYDAMKRAKAFIFAAEEDFGIAPVEAMACGTPVIAYGKGGATETVLDGITGLFFKEQSRASLQEAIVRFENTSFSAEACRQQAERFSEERFQKEIRAVL